MVVRTMVRSGLLDSNPAAVWTLHRTGLLPAEENFEDMPPEDQEECEATWGQWGVMDPAAQVAFIARIHGLVASLERSD